MVPSRIVAVDLGGTFLKVGLFEDGELAWTQRTRVAAFQESPGLAGRLSPGLLTRGITSALEMVSERTTVADAVMVTGQMAGLALLDPEGCSSKSLLTWQESSSVDREAVPSDVRFAFENTTGERLAPHLPLLKLHECDLPQNASVTSLIGYVANVVSGSAGSAIHITDAASWGMCDVRTGAWVPELLKFAGVTEVQLPRISWNVDQVGFCERLSAPVFSAVGDQQAALLGAALQTSEVSVNLATGCQVSLRSLTDETPFQIRPFFAGEFLKTRTHLPAGRLLESAVNKAYGTITPAAWDQARRDVLAGIAPKAVSAAVGEIAVAIAQTYRVLTEGEARRILFTGGLIQRFPAIQRQLEDELGVASRVFADEDAALTGLASLAVSI